MNTNVENLVVDTTAFIQNASLQNVGQNIVTCQDVVDEITNKRQLRRLVVLPYDLIVKDVDPDNVRAVTEFAKKTGDYPCLSATDIKVMALTYQLEKEHVGTGHLRSEPTMQCAIKVTASKQDIVESHANIIGFYVPGSQKKIDAKSDVLTTDNNDSNNDLLENIDEELREKFKTLDVAEHDLDEDLNVLIKFEGEVDEVHDHHKNQCQFDEESTASDDDDDDAGWITPSNVQKAKKEIKSDLMEEKSVKVACMTTDFAMQNVLKQMNLNVAALDGRMIKQLRTFILRCYACFATTSIMTKLFCSKCGNKTLKRVAVSLNEKGEQQIHINARRPLTGRGTKFSLPKIQGGKHSNNPLLVEDQPMPDQRPTRLARTKTNPLDDDYIAGYSPFVMRDVTSKSAQLKIRPVTEVKNWMRKNPNEAMRRRRK